MKDNKTLYHEMECRKSLLNAFEGTMEKVTKSFDNYLFVLEEIRQDLEKEEDVQQLEILAEFTDVTYHKLNKNIDRVHTITEDIYGQLIKIKQKTEGA